MKPKAFFQSLVVMAALVSAMAGCLRLAAQASSKPPELMVFQGEAVDGAGQPIGGAAGTNQPAVVRIFDSYTGGKLLWSEQHVLTIEGGRFAILMGEGSGRVGEPRPALSSVFLDSTASDRYVEVTLLAVVAGGGDRVISPRMRLLTSPTAFLARHSRTTEKLVNGTGTTVLTATESRVGIHQPQPGEALDVGGTIRASKGTVAGDVTVAGSVVAGGVDALGTAPLGTVVMWSGVVPPRGWSLCDGRVANGRQTPDLRGRFLMASGQGPGLAPRASGATGGAEGHVLKPHEIPSHDHSWDPPTVEMISMDGEHAHPYISGYKSPWFIGAGDRPRQPWAIDWMATDNPTSAEGDHSHRLTMNGHVTATSGESRPHATMPPFHVLAFIMRVQ